MNKRFMLALAANDITPFLTQHYQPASSGSATAQQWYKNETPGFLYHLCLDQPLDASQRLLVMCGDGDDDRSAGADSGYFDIWYVRDGEAVSTLTAQGAGRYGQSGEARAVKISDKRWAVALESGYSLQGFTQSFQHYYVVLDNKLVNVANVVTHSDNQGFCDPAERSDCQRDNLDTRVSFGQQEFGQQLPPMRLTAKGELAGKPVDKRWTVAFDAKTQRYAIPDEINIGY